MTAYYNEIDPFAAQWLRNLIDAGHIAPGVVDTRSIEDVVPNELKGFTQCHFFAGVGVWSLALRRAGWPDDRPVWTGSCPCQPFSSAGASGGFADERHLWPSFFHLIEQCKPATVFGEQVASKDAEPWIDLVQDDVEAMGYAFGAVAFPAASVGAPHIRDRLYWVAHANEQQRPDGQRTIGPAHEARGREQGAAAAAGLCGDSRLGHTNGITARGDARAICGPLDREDREHIAQHADASGAVIGLADNPSSGRGEECEDAGRGVIGDSAQGQPTGSCNGGGDLRPSPTNGFWRDADWLLCRDGKWRPVEPGFEQMADGSSSSLGRVCADTVEEIESEVNAWEIRYQTVAAEGLLRVWRDLQSQALCEREIGRFSGVQSPPVLLAFLRQLTEQGWRFSDALACSRSGASEILLRVMRFDGEAARTPLRRELAEQLWGEPADPLRELSSVLAHYATHCWGEACRQKAGAASFPLANNTSSRVGRLRAYGNAINAQAAQAFIEATGL